MIETQARPRDRRFWLIPLALLIFTLLTAGVALAGLPTKQGPASPSSPSGCCSDQLYYQDDNSDDTYTDSYTNTEGYESQAADDFVVPEDATWGVYYVSARVYTCCDGDVTVYFYDNVVSGTQNIPGTLVYSETFEYDPFETAPRSASPSGFGYTYQFGYYDRAMVVLEPGHYWVSVRGSDWPLMWGNRTITSNSPAAWRNPGGPPPPDTPTATETPTETPTETATAETTPGAYNRPLAVDGDSACADWGTRSTDCGQDAQAPDQRFAIYGVVDQDIATPVVEACGVDWRVVPSENYPGTTQPETTGSNELNGVAAVSATDGWAVGAWRTPTSASDSTFEVRHKAASAPSAPSGSSSQYEYPLIERWDGDSFTIFPSPVITNGESDNPLHATLYGVDEAAADDVWAVGNYFSTSPAKAPDAPEGYSYSRTLIMNFDGSDWSVIDSPNFITGTRHYLYQVDAESADEAWAVGYYYPDDGNDRSLIERWDGETWQLVDSPNYTATDECCAYNYLYGVSAVPGTDEVWAVGTHYANPDYNDRPITMHFDGTSWQLVENPFTGVEYTGSYSYIWLNAVYAVASDDVWAVGIQMLGADSNYDERALIMHWDGEAWSEVASPNRAGSNELTGIKAISADDIWAVGFYGSGGGRNAPDAPNGTERSPLTLHWDGVTWHDVSNPQLEHTRSDYVLDVDGVASEDVLAVGVSQENANEWSSDTTLAEQYSDPCAPDLTTCEAQDFPDVPPGSTFYPFVRCLVCQGIVGGFPDGTYKPAANVTRGQLAKIVAKAAGFDDAIPVRHTFADVPYSTDVSSYWIYVERLFAHGVIDGYECGGMNSQTGEAEPCDSENRPYYRPSNSVTRGQASKIVAGAAGFNEEIPTAQQTYEDVPSTGEGSTFWVFIERLSDRHVVGGYECGTGPAGDCEDGNRAYFLPNDSLSRGQAAKIVANTFFPDCQTSTRPK